MTNKSDKHKQESANNRCWNTIFFQKFNLALDKETDKQYHSSHGNCHDTISLDGKKGINNLKRHVRILLFS